MWQDLKVEWNKMRGKKSKNKIYSNKHQIFQVIVCNTIILYYYILYV